MREHAQQKVSSTRNLSLSPLTFEEAVTDILKVKPEPKAAKKKIKAADQTKTQLQKY